jgi:hypothetical protein
MSYIIQNNIGSQLLWKSNTHNEKFIPSGYKIVSHIYFHLLWNEKLGLFIKLMMFSPIAYIWMNLTTYTVELPFPSSVIMKNIFILSVKISTDLLMRFNKGTQNKKLNKFTSTDHHLMLLKTGFFNNIQLLFCQYRLQTRNGIHLFWKFSLLSFIFFHLFIFL